MSVAVVHEWFETFAGSERVVQQVLDAYRDADLYALVDFLPESQRDAVRHKAVHTSFIQHLPFARRAFRHYLPLMPAAIEQLDLSGHEIVISSNHAFAKGVVTRADQLHVSYTHTPIRYAWDLQHEYLRQAGLARGLKNVVVRATLHYLRLWDRITSDRVDAFIANSRYIARRIAKTYRRSAYVVYPPVDVDSFPLHEHKEDFYLAASRMVPYKRIDLIVDAFARMPNRKLIVIGDGPELAKLSHRAPRNVSLLGYQTHEVLRTHMQKARAFVFAAEEDFGIMPVEAQACGTPVIAYGRGGATETIVDGRSGLFFDRQTPEAIQAAVDGFESVRHRMAPELIRAHAERFGPQRFRGELSCLVDRLWSRFCQRTENDRFGSPFPLDRAVGDSAGPNVTAVRRRKAYPANVSGPVGRSTRLGTERFRLTSPSGTTTAARASVGINGQPTESPAR